MQFEALKIFCDVVRHRSFSQAAALNNVSQSAASQTVLQLERRLGVQLIDRSTRPLQLTPWGQVYYQGCQGLVEQYLELEASIRRQHQQRSCTVEVAAIYSVGLGDMGQLVERFAQQQPHARVHVEYLHPDRVYERVLQGTADFGLVSFPKTTRELKALPWRDEPMVVACAPTHRLARRSAVPIAALAGEKYIHFDRGLVIRREVDRFLREHGVAVDVVIEFDNVENIKQAVTLAAGIALLPEPTLRREVAAGTLAAVPLADARLVRPLGVVQRRQHRLSGAAQGFLDLLLQSSGRAASNGVSGPQHHANHRRRPTAARRVR
ncbi:MAG: LysR family transcriptional regulator [Gemmataceae bacterium]|nr:LysR family transcriptional regulator [Gemmataceae bacterium]MDW8264037.1 LysR family transcriptional regulator [Gemmataceae bacterium]